MSRFLIIPQIKSIDRSLELASEYGFGFEYNDFFLPDVMDDAVLTEDIISRYKSAGVPDICTMHGAFFDVLIFSYDKKIREISELRVRQSLDIARKIDAKGVIFHTNHNPDLTAEAYIRNWFDCNEKFWRGILDDYPDLEIYMENMFDTSPDMLAGMAERLSDKANFGVCFDYAHAVIYGSDIEKWVTSLAPYVKHMHINDNDLKNDLHLAAGDGQINWERFKYHFETYFADVKTVLIETSSLENQRRSAEFLRKLGMI